MFANTRIASGPARVNYNAIPHMRIIVKPQVGKPVGRSEVMNYHVKYTCGSFQTTLEDSFEKVKWLGISNFKLSENAKGTTAFLATAFEVSNPGGPDFTIHYEVLHTFGGPDLSMEGIELKARGDRQLFNKNFTTKKTKILNTKMTNAHMGKVVYGWADIVAQEAMLAYEDSASIRMAAFTGRTASGLPPELKIALDQLTRSPNGIGRLRVMIGAKDFLFSSEDMYVRFKHMSGGEHARLRRNAAMTRLTYNYGRDDYTLTFFTRTGSEIKEIDGLYGEDLKRVFEENTGLYLSLS